MNFPLFVARRIRKTQDTSFSKTVTYVGIGTIAVGTAIILVAFAILFGFKSAIQEKLTSFSGNIRVSKLSGNHSVSESPIYKNTAWEKSVAMRSTTSPFLPLRRTVSRTMRSCWKFILRGSPR